MLALLTTFLSALPDMIVDVIMVEYASKKPNIDLPGWFSSGGKQAIEDVSQQSQLPRDPEKDDRIESISNILNITKLALDDQLSVDEEVQDILSKAQILIAEDIEAQFSNNILKKIVLRRLGLQDNGHLEPLSLSNNLFYFGDAHGKLRHKISEARKHAELIRDEVKAAKEAGYEDSLNTILIQYFIMDQLTKIRKFSYSKQCAGYNSVIPENIDLFSWLASWSIVSCSFIFMVYWIFSWGVYNGGVTLKSWSINFIVTVVQDIFLVQPAKIFILYVITTKAMRPQLQKIYRTLNDAVTRNSLTDWSYEFRVVQKLSGACRAARLIPVSELPAAQLLRSLNNDQEEKCRDSRFDVPGIILSVLIIIPGVIALVYPGLADSVIEFFFPLFAGGFITLHSFLLSISPFMVCVPYIIIVGLVCIKESVIFPALQRVRNLNASTESFGQKWRRSKRTRYYYTHGAWFKRIFSSGINQLALTVVRLASIFMPNTVHEYTGRLTSENDHRAQMWQLMNSPMMIQGLVMEPFATNESIICGRYAHSDNHRDCAEESSSMGELINHINNTEINVPPEILGLIPVINSSKLVGDLMKCINSRVFLNKWDDHEHTPVMDTTNEYQIYQNNRTYLAEEMRAILITWSMETALQKIFQPLKGVDGMISEEQEIKALIEAVEFSPVVDCKFLYQRFCDVWVVFHPNQRHLSAQELSEVKIEFAQAWGHVSNVSVADFAKWFSELVNFITRIRRDNNEKELMDEYGSGSADSISKSKKSCDEDFFSSSEEEEGSSEDDSLLLAYESKDSSYGSLESPTKVER
jgi:hypothetical protein